MSAGRDARLLYVADPLCSWCYGFGPELATLLERRPDLGLDLLMGGLRPYNTETMSEAFRDMLRGHWAHVAQVSGLAFSEAIFEVPGFVYDTEPPCRAVVTARALDPARAFALMKDIHITEAKHLEFRAEMFNFLNHTNFRLPDSDISSPTFNHILAAQPPRLVQFALKFTF